MDVTMEGSFSLSELIFCPALCRYGNMGMSNRRIATSLVSATGRWWGFTL